MNTLATQIQELQQLANELFCLGVNGTPIYANHFCDLNLDVLNRADVLFHLQGVTDEEEGNLCLALLMGYSATIYGDKEEKKQSVLDRSCRILDLLPASLLKCRLLTYCYGEVFEDSLAEEAHAIMNGWNNRVLSDEEQTIIQALQVMEENQYPHSDVEE